MFKLSKVNIANTALIIAAFAFTVYFGYSNYQARKQLKKEKSELSEKIEQLQQTIEKNNQIIAQREQEKNRDAISIKQLHEQMKDALKNNQCANEIMPSNISDWMRNGKN